MTEGMTDLFNFYTHDGECFIFQMNKKYGKDNWKPLEYEGENDGYYEANGEDTGIFYTEWYRDGCESDEIEEYVEEKTLELLDAISILDGPISDHTAIFETIMKGVSNAVQKDLKDTLQAKVNKKMEDI